MDIVDSPSNGLELCLGSLQEMPGTDDIYEHVRRFARRQRIGYIHFRNVRGKVPNYHETFVDDGDIDMAEIVRILRDEDYDGVISPTIRRRCPATRPGTPGKLLRSAICARWSRTPRRSGLARTAQSTDTRMQAS